MAPQRIDYASLYDAAKRFENALGVYAEAIERASFPQLIRAGHARGSLNEELVVCTAFRDRRNATSHGHDGRKAREILGTVPRFFAEEKFALAEAPIRARGDMAQEELARAMGTTQAVIARLESGRVKPSTRTLERLAAATHTRPRIGFEPQTQAR